MQDASPRRRLLAVLTLTLVPWTVVVVGDDVTLVTAFALVTPTTSSVTSVVAYYGFTGGSPPASTLPWVLGSGVYLLTVASAAAALIDREDRRLTTGLLVLVGAIALSVAVGFTRRPGYVAVPLGTVLAWGLAWWAYRDGLRRLVRPDRERREN